jgi:hypothetical protein
MAGAMHTDARSALFDRMSVLVSKGCKKWQSKKDGWPRDWESRWEHGEIRKLRIPAFLRTECDDAAYNFWNAIDKARQHPDAMSVKGPLAAEHFCERLRKSSYFEKAELDEFFDYFKNYYWKVEISYLNRRKDALRLDEAFDRISNNQGSVKFFSDRENYLDGSILKIWSAYRENNYEYCADYASAIIWKSMDFVNTLDSRDEQVKFLGDIGQLLIHCGALQLNLSMYKALDESISRLRGAGKSGIAIRSSEDPKNDRHFLIHGLGEVQYALHRGIMGNYADWARHGRLISSVTSFMRFNSCRDQTSQVKRGPVFSLPNRFACSNILMARSDLLILNRSMDTNAMVFDKYDEAEFLEYFRELPSSLGDAPRAKACASIMTDPMKFLEFEYAAIKDGIADDDTIGKSMMEILIANTLVSESRQRPSDALKWLCRAKDSLADVKCHLAWSDFYLSCAGYMHSRGNSTMEWRALSAASDLQVAAGNMVKAAELERSAVERATTPLAVVGNAASGKEIDLVNFLLKPPPSLAKNKKKENPETGPSQSRAVSAGQLLGFR